MKKRLISISVGLVLLAAILLWLDTLLAPIAFSIIGAIAIFELTRALKLNDNLMLFAILSLAHIYNIICLPDAFYFTYILMIFVFCFIMFSKNRHYSFKEGASAFVGTIMISFGIRSIIVIENMTTTTSDARFLFVIALCLGWICDTFAYIFGRLFGKRKLCPSISPNKTIAGAVGGIVGTPIFVAIAYWLYASNCSADSLFSTLNQPQHILFFAIVGLVGAIVGIVGDLAASYIKRECEIKDFGNIMPGHGGALDRLDSVFFTCVFASLAYEMFFMIF